MTPPDFHFVSLNPGIALRLGGVKASMPIHILRIGINVGDVIVEGSDLYDRDGTRSQLVS
jgi:hypothetical protein